MALGCSFTSYTGCEHWPYCAPHVVKGCATIGTGLTTFLLVVRMLLVAMPGAPSSILVPSSKARSPVASC